MSAGVELPERLNLAAHLLDARVAEGRGERRALVDDQRELTYREVRILAHRYGHLLRRLGVRPEERVLIALPDGADYVGALFGILEIGAVAVMVNPGFDDAAVATLLATSRAGAAVVDAGLVATYEAAAERASWRRPLLVPRGDAGRHTSFAAAEATLPEEIEVADTHRDDPAIWLFSGGTTGRPKAAVQTHGSFVNTTELYARRTLGYREDDVTLAVPKLFFGYATGSNLFFPFAVGATATLFPEPATAEALFARIARHRPTILVNVPTLVQRMVAHPTASEQDFSSLRFATSAGEALPPALYRRWRETFGVELLDGLGTAEMWHVFLTNRPGDVRPGTLGRVVEGFEIAVRDDAGRDLGPDEVGRLWVRGASRAWGYWQDLPATARAFHGEWFVGGDLVSRDEEGYVTYCGRDDDVLKVGGKWLVPREVEACLAAHPAVRECTVVGADDEHGLTKPFAFVVPTTAPGDDDDGGGGDADREALAEALKSWCLERLAPYKHPRRVILVADLPRTHLGKVDRGALRRRLG